MEKSKEDLDFYVVLDFEATCEKEKHKQEPQEIIEFPSVLIDAKKQIVVSKFQEYIRPVHKPKLSAFCTELTGITQDKVDNAEEFTVVFQNYQNWIKKEIGDKNFTFITCGDWDLKTMLPKQLKLSKISSPKYFSKWINIKEVFAKNTNTRAKGMVGMLEHFSIKLQGRHHSGIDDCKNISSVVLKMMELEMPITETNTAVGNCHHCGSPEHFQYDCPQYLESSASRFRNDWTCSCGEVNFARRNECRSCRKAKGGSRASNDREREKPRRDGDWDCSSCGALNFARRSSCFSCNRPSNKDSEDKFRRPGDWDCASCGMLNFAYREKCKACSSSK
eukprot:TRINITY_DN2380_c0_g1_i3.p1 TRINITY_DN2380_c0_g1~~TRINITY_DN2380_c0_g1_i3.p1  ORF type:complete len:334 (+),score=47.86 TRINITY_DN2380_c0_g1_i3:862-1863(+)